jgi:hypothetical protein
MLCRLIPRCVNTCGSSLESGEVLVVGLQRTSHKYLSLTLATGAYRATPSPDNARVSTPPISANLPVLADIINAKAARLWHD